MTVVDTARFERDGYVVLPGFVEASSTVSLRAAIESAATVDADNPLSLDSMRFASNLYRSSPSIREFLASPPVVELVTGVLGPDVWVRWDQAVWKGPGAPVFPWHQDNGYTGLPAMHLQLWIALTPMTTANGGLLVEPGGHLRRPAHRWAGNHVEIDPPDEVVAVTAAAGDAVLFSSFLPHATTRNDTGEERLAYVAEFLPTAVADPSVVAPHLVVARDGHPHLALDDLSTGWAGSG